MYVWVCEGEGEREGVCVSFLIQDLLAISTAWKSLQFILLLAWRFIRTNTGFLDMCACVFVCARFSVYEHVCMWVCVSDILSGQISP